MSLRFALLGTAQEVENKRGDNKNLPVDCLKGFIVEWAMLNSCVVFHDISGRTRRDKAKHKPDIKRKSSLMETTTIPGKFVNNSTPAGAGKLSSLKHNLQSFLTGSVVAGAWLGAGFFLIAAGFIFVASFARLDNAVHRSEIASPPTAPTAPDLTKTSAAERKEITELYERQVTAYEKQVAAYVKQAPAYKETVTSYQTLGDDPRSYSTAYNQVVKETLVPLFKIALAIAVGLTTVPGLVTMVNNWRSPSGTSPSPPQKPGG